MGGTSSGPPADLQARIRQRTLDLLSSAQACCVICLDKIHEPCEAAPCRHADFDYICLLEWLSRTPRCPLCVQPVTGVKHKVDGKDVTTPVDVLEKAEPKPAPAPTQNDLFLDPYRLRNARRQRGSRRPRPAPRSAPNLGIEGRRKVYQQGLFSKHVGSNRMSQYRELTPALFNIDVNLVSRARAFLRRELQVFPFLNAPEQEAAPSSTTTTTTTTTQTRRADNAEFLLEYIVAVLKSVDIVGGRAEDLVTDFLGREHTRLFLHELRAWLRSPFEKLEDWDRAVQYAVPLTLGPCSSAEGSSQRSQYRGDRWTPARERRRQDPDGVGVRRRRQGSRP